MILSGDSGTEKVPTHVQEVLSGIMVPIVERHQVVAHSESSSFREKLLEHLFVGEVLRTYGATVGIRRVPRRTGLRWSKHLVIPCNSIFVICS